MVRSKGAMFLIEAIIKNKETLLNNVLKPYSKQGFPLSEGFEKLAACLVAGKVDSTARKELQLKHEERFGSTSCAAHLIERGVVNGHENYEYEWYLHIDYNQSKKEFLELFINRIFIAQVSLALMIKDYAERETKEETWMVDPVELVTAMDNEKYRTLLSQILGDSDRRIQSIMDDRKSPSEGVIQHHYVSQLYGGVSTRELVQYASKAATSADEFALLALDQKIDAVMKTLAGKNQAKEMEILLGLGYLLDLYHFDFESMQTSYRVQSEVSNRIEK